MAPDDHPRHVRPGFAVTAFALVWGNLGALAFAAVPLTLLLAASFLGPRAWRAAAGATAVWALWVALGPKPHVRGSLGRAAWRRFSESFFGFALMRAYLGLTLEVDPATKALPLETPVVLALSQLPIMRVLSRTSLAGNVALVASVAHCAEWRIVDGGLMPEKGKGGGKDEV